MSLIAGAGELPVRPVNLADAVVLITGGAHGIGRAVATRVSQLGGRVVIADVNDAAGRATADELGAVYVRTDVTDYAQVQAAVAATEEAYGGLDVAFLNAGISSGFTFDDFDPEKYRRAMAVNVDGVAYGVAAALPALRRRGGGAIVMTASLAGLVPAAFDPVYGANKHAVVGLARSLAPAVAGDGIAVQALCPGYAETNIITDIRQALVDAGWPIIPVERVVEGFELAVASPSSGHCWVIQPGREPVSFQFRNVPGPRNPDGSPLAPSA